jgi:autotransporter translocation and assembly factor TamB
LGALAALALVAVFLGRPIALVTIKLGLRGLGRVIKGRVEVGRIGGRLSGAPVLEDVRVVLGRDSILATRLEFEYNLLGYLRGRLGLDRLRVVEPRVYLSGAADTTQPATQPARGGRFPRLGVRGLTVERGAVFVAGERLVDSVELALAAESRPEVVSVALERGSLFFVPESITVRRLNADGHVTRDSAVLDTLRLSAPGLWFDGSARVGFADGGIKAAMRALDVSLERFLDVPGRFQAAGEGELEAGVPGARLDYRASGLRWQRLSLPEVSGRLALADSVLTLTLAGSNADLGGVELDGRVRLRTWEFGGRAVLRDVAVRRIEPSLPEFRVSAVAEVGGRGVDSVWCSARARSTELGVDSLVARGLYRAGAVTVEKLELAGAVGRAWADGAWDGRRGRLNLMLDSFDLALAGTFLGESLQGRVGGVVSTSGSADSFDVSGGLRANGLFVPGAVGRSAVVEMNLSVGKTVQGHCAVGVESLAAAGRQFDLVQVVWSGEDFEVRADLPRNRLLALGTASIARDGFAASVSRLEFATDRETLANAGPFEVSLSDGALAVSGFAAEVGGGRIEGSGGLGRDGKPQFTVTARSLDLAKAADLAGTLYDVRGVLDATVEYRDAPKVELHIRDLVAPELNVRLRGVEGRLGIAGDTVLVEQLDLVHIDSAGTVDTSHITGRVELALGDPWPIRDVDLAARVNNPGSWVLTFLKPTIDARRGTVYGDLRVRGDLVTPDIRGRLRVSRAELYVDPIKATMDRVNGELTLAGRRVNFEKVTGRSRRGTVVASGYVELGRNFFVDTLHVDVNFNGVEASPLKDVVGVASGDIALDWHQPLPILLTGRINVEEALVTIDPGAPVVTGGTPDTTLVYDLQVKGDRGIWWRSSLADIELSVDMSLKRTLQEEVYNGVLTSRQGNVYYLDRTLRVTSGTVTFPNVNRLNPELDIAAELPLPQNGAGADQPQKIVLGVTGTVEQPELAFRSDPPVWDNVQVLSYLNLNATPEQLRDIEGQQAVTRMLSDRLLSYFQTRVAKRARGFARLDYLEFESGLLGDARTRLTVGKYIGPNLYVSYTQYFDEQFAPAFRIEYYVDRRNEVVAARDDDGRFSLRYRFKLRY